MRLLLFPFGMLSLSFAVVQAYNNPETNGEKGPYEHRNHFTKRKLSAREQLQLSSGLPETDCDITTDTLKKIPELLGTDYINVPNEKNRRAALVRIDHEFSFSAFVLTCKFLGLGGSGFVSSGRNLFTNEIVAIKQFNLGTSLADADKEIKHLTHLRLNLGTAHYQKEYFNGGSRLVAMPFVRGITLEAILDDRKTKKTPEGLLELLRRVARNVMAKLFRQGFAHYDLKGDNIFVTDFEEDGFTPTDNEDSITPIDFGTGDIVNIKDNGLEKYAFRTIVNSLLLFWCGGGSYSGLGEDWKEFRKQENAKRTVVLEMYNEIRKGCPDCNLPSRSEIPEYIETALGVKRAPLLGPLEQIV